MRSRWRRPADYAPQSTAAATNCNNSYNNRQQQQQQAATTRTLHFIISAIWAELSRSLFISLLMQLTCHLSDYLSNWLCPLPLSFYSSLVSVIVACSFSLSLFLSVFVSAFALWPAWNAAFICFSWPRFILLLLEKPLTRQTHIYTHTHVCMPWKFQYKFQLVNTCEYTRVFVREWRVNALDFGPCVFFVLICH